MALKIPYGQNNYMGEYANDAACLTFIQGQKWDSTQNGSGDPQEGMFYYNTTSDVFIGYFNGNWRNMQKPASNAYYWGKHGDNGNDGKDNENAFLTLTYAISQASDGDTVICFDNGAYDEDITCTAGVNIYAPNMELTGKITLKNGVHVHMRRIEGDDSDCITMDVTGFAYVTADELETVEGSDLVVANTEGSYIYVTAKRCIVNGVDDACRGFYASGGNIILNIDVIWLEDTSVNANAIVCSSATSEITGRVGQIVDKGGAGGSGRGIAVSNGSLKLLVNDIEVGDEGVYVVGGVCNVTSSSIIGYEYGVYVSAGSCYVTSPYISGGTNSLKRTGGSLSASFSHLNGNTDGTWYSPDEIRAQFLGVYPSGSCLGYGAGTAAQFRLGEYPSGVGGSGSSLRVGFKIPNRAQPGRDWKLQIIYLNLTAEYTASSMKYYASAYSGEEAYGSYNEASNVTLGDLTSATTSRRYQQTFTLGTDVEFEPGDVVTLMLYRTNSPANRIQIVSVDLIQR